MDQRRQLADIRAPTGPADAMGEDRILELAFDRDISAAEVEASIQEGLDVPG